jgi:hypothetical protein
VARNLDPRKNAATMLDLSSNTSQNSVDYQATPVLPEEIEEEREVNEEEQPEEETGVRRYGIQTFNYDEVKPYENDATFVVQDEEDIEYTDAPYYKHTSMVDCLLPKSFRFARFLLFVLECIYLLLFQ